MRIKAPLATHCRLTLSQKIRLAALPDECIKKFFNTSLSAKDKGRFAKVRGGARTTGPMEARPESGLAFASYCYPISS